VSERAGITGEIHSAALHRAFFRRAPLGLIPDTGLCKLDAHAVVYMGMKKRRLTRRDEDVEHAYILIVEFEVVPRLLLNRHGSLGGSGCKESQRKEQPNQIVHLDTSKRYGRFLTESPLTILFSGD
jgi:hypothetical protein